jgi:poly(A) polymerase
MKIIKKFLEFISGNEAERAVEPREPAVVPRGSHAVSRKNIDADALKVLNRLNRFKHSAYLVGGGVRDLLLDRGVKDFDIATSAHPNEVKKLFRNSRLIGRRFRLVHILFRGQKVIEVSTFRRHAGFNDEGELLIKSDNTFGTAEEDARRRDFTVNGLFYNIADFTVIDYVEGLKDLDARVIATIGDPNIRFREDPIRMLRAVRFAARLDFTIAPDTHRAIMRHRKEIWKGAVPRILDELLKMLQQGAAVASFRLLKELKLLEVILPGLSADFDDEERGDHLRRVLQAIDGLSKPKGGASPAFLFSALYFPGYNALLRSRGDGTDKLKLAGELLSGDLAKINFPKLQMERARQLLAAQSRIENIGKKKIRPALLVRKTYFEDALTLFEITRPRSRENLAVVRRWRSLKKKIESGDPEKPAPAEGEPGRKRQRSRRRRRPSGAATSTESSTSTAPSESSPSSEPSAPSEPVPSSSDSSSDSS